jgi:CheY-like chemotaxis protein
MPNTRKILIVDDDPEMRDALTEQLSLHQEFETLAVENGSKWACRPRRRGRSIS